MSEEKEREEEEVKERVLKVLQEKLEVWYTPWLLASEMGENEGDIEKALKSLVEDGLVEESTVTVYRLR